METSAFDAPLWQEHLTASKSSHGVKKTRQSENAWSWSLPLTLIGLMQDNGPEYVGTRNPSAEIYLKCLNVFLIVKSTRKWIWNKTITTSSGWAREAKIMGFCISGDFLSPSYLGELKSQDGYQTTLPSYFSLSRQLTNKTEDSKWFYHSRKLSHYCDKERTVDSHKQASTCLMGLKRYRKNVVKRQRKKERNTVLLSTYTKQHVASSPTEFCRGKRNVKLPSNLLPKWATELIENI